MDLAEVIAAAFMAGVKQQAKAEGKKAGKKTVKYVIEDLPSDLVEGYRQHQGREKKVKRKASAYSKKYGAVYKRLKKKHPRMAFGALAKKAHKEMRKGSTKKGQVRKTARRAYER